MKALKKFVWNAALLTVTSLIMRGVAVAFNVYISNKVGAEALGLFSLMSSVYGFALTLATSGIALAVTRMVAEALGKDDDKLIRSSMKCCLIYALSFGLAAAVLLFCGADFIGNVWLDDVRTIKSLRILSITLPLIALCSAMNGYFTAVRRVVKNALSQVAEQAAKIGITVFLLTAVFPSGIENACIALVLGGAVSEILSFFIMFTMYLYDKKKHITYNGGEISHGSTAKRLLGIAIPVALSTYARSGLLTIEHILIPLGLRKNGSTRERSLAAYGTLTAMVMPVVLFPSALISSFAGMTIPELAESRARGQTNRIKYISGRVFQLSLLFSVGVAGIMMCYSNELGEVLYSNREASAYIGLLAPLIPVMYLDSTTDAMLKGLGEQLYSMNVNIIDALISVVLVWLLLPEYGINGYIFIIFIMEILNFGLSASRLMIITGLRPKIFRWVVKPVACIVGSTGFTEFLFSRVGSLTSVPALDLTLHILISALIYFALLAATFSFNREDIQWFKSIFKRDAQ